MGICLILPATLSSFAPICNVMLAAANTLSLSEIGINKPNLKNRAGLMLPRKPC